MYNLPILYIEDEPADVFFLQDALQRAGVSNGLLTAEDGQKALDVLQAMASGAQPMPILVLLDLKLPRKSGLEVLEWIRKQPGLRKLIVLVYTSSDISSDISAAYEKGANGYLVKPSSSDKLLLLVEALRDFWLIHNCPPPLRGS